MRTSAKVGSGASAAAKLHKMKNVKPRIPLKKKAKK